MQKEYILWSGIDNWLNAQGMYNRKIAKKVFALMLQIDSESIGLINVKHQCANIFTCDYLYKIQLYGNSVRRDLHNRKLFAELRLPVVSPIKVCRRHPLVVRMPILQYPHDNETAADHILAQLSRTGRTKEFRLNDYPRLMEGLRILTHCNDIGRDGSTVKDYLHRNEGAKVRTGIVHGDFHRGNVMRKGSRPLLIDFDCVRACDIQAVDALYYILEEVRHQHGYQRTWLQEWLVLFENTDLARGHKCYGQIDIDVKFGLVLLFLERLTQENKIFIEKNMLTINRINRKICCL